VIHPIAKDIVEKVFGHIPVPEIGKRYLYNNRVVEVTSGQFWGTYGVSNFWKFRYVNPDGTLGEQGGDYGGCFWDLFQTMVVNTEEVM
jgi:hypothetical protein